MGWDNLRLAEKTAGSEYGETTVRVADLLEKLSAETGDNATPAVVWLYDPTDDKSNRSLEGTVFQNEQIALAMKKFRRYRVNVEEIGNRELREEYSKNLPAFRFYDPSGNELAKLSGRKATSLSSFSQFLGKTWSVSFTTRMKDFSRSMVKILDRLDKLDGRKQIHARDLERLQAKPNPRKQNAVKKEGEELKVLEEQILADETELLASVALRADFRPDETADSR